ncbi:acetyltransferase [Marinibaculum pumilum]|uniref:Acetyltransferase n=1 Tax=Marinibaculum pumilum TaxID=1766165 RepID=A0ABV7L0Q1_9PROT
MTGPQRADDGVQFRLSCAADRDALHGIWDRAVRATHGFLSPAHHAEISRMLHRDYLGRAELLVAVRAIAAREVLLGFMGMTGRHIDALFIDPAASGCGLGRRFVAQARRRGVPLTVDVNEQNTGALGFYLHLGFVRVGRSPCDGDGRPYPILHLREPPGSR